jgi:nucleoside-diphosphate-sugar epimerase
VTEARVLVTGATGFIAGHCIEELLTHGYAVRGTVRNRVTADVAHLHAMAERTGGSLELVEARLDADEGWAAAAAGCTYVWHLASPNPPETPKDENEIIKPAVDGTLRLLRAAAASGTVRRVVLTSSCSAIIDGHEPDNSRVFTEADWSIVERCEPYPKSKVYAERAAWDFVKDTALELVVINPGLVIGPVLHNERPTSIEVVRRLVTRDFPAVPRMGFATVDARDLATAHRLAMEAPQAAGQRYICAGSNVWMREMALLLADEYAPRGYRLPTRPLPYWAMWAIARFDKTVRFALPFVGRAQLVTAAKARKELDWTMRPARQSLVDTAESLLDHGVVPRSATDKPARQPVPSK